MKNFLIGLIVGILLTMFFYNSVDKSQNKNPNQFRSNSIILDKSKNENTLSTSDFEIVSYRGEWKYGNLKVIGEIKNNGSIAAGAEVEVIARDENGVLIDSKSFWPSSITNMPSQSTTGISYTITNDQRAKSISIKVIDVKVWKK
ncbi:MAG: hypothetical protein GY932_01045 [Arcobacter sp.]|nr:hypothetical protein [Arcobacter sp.]